MDNERAIEAIKGFIVFHLGFLSDEQFVAMELAIKALEQSQGNCKNCKNFKKSLCENSPYGWCSIRRATQEGDLETQVPKDYYCSWFEKDGGDT